MTKLIFSTRNRQQSSLKSVNHFPQIVANYSDYNFTKATVQLFGGTDVCMVVGFVEHSLIYPLTKFIEIPSKFHA